MTDYLIALDHLIMQDCAKTAVITKLMMQYFCST